MNPKLKEFIDNWKPTTIDFIAVTGVICSGFFYSFLLYLFVKAFTSWLQFLGVTDKSILSIVTIIWIVYAFKIFLKSFIRIAVDPISRSINTVEYLHKKMKGGKKKR